MNTSAQLRQLFLDFFAERDHEVVRSSPLVPANDPTLLFTNAGMVQFKEVFLGLDERARSRATSSQRCVRAGGKHNDLENVGYTARHHTFFEMLGNFSFGDYFKTEAIPFAWEFLTQVLQLPPERLWVTIYEDDDEAADIWLNTMKIDPTRFSRLGADSNFWSMGETGPCGPCSEIFYDHGEHVPGGPPGTPEEDGDRYVEIWNLVFMQYNRDAAGALTPLPKPSVDTGMGLERLAAVMQGVHSNYDIDLFQGLIAAAAQVIGSDDLTSNSLRVIADHIRSCAFLIVDGVLPGNEGRGYVLRRIIRRAVRHGYKLGMNQPFFHQLVEPLCQQMGDAYPELVAAKEQVAKILLIEEKQFAETVEQGMRLLEDSIANLKGQVIDGQTVFRLYDTYGFPIDLTADVARERGLEIDAAGFDQAMQAQKERGRSAGRFKVAYPDADAIQAVSHFSGYENLHGQAVVTHLLQDGAIVQQLAAGQDGVVILEHTPFYAESGGQVGDVGVLYADGVKFTVEDTQKLGDAITHLGRVEQGELSVGLALQAEVDGQRRLATALNHSATHLLHAALRKVLGSHVTQKGSLVEPERLRFDFSHYEAISPVELIEIEEIVNVQIRTNYAVNTQVMGYDEALEHGAMALFGEKYGSEVRVLTMGDFSVELCGGTHVKRAGDIGLFKIIAESGVASGVRRIEALTGASALQWIRETEQLLQGVAGLVRGGRTNVNVKVQSLLEQTRQYEKELSRLKDKLASQQSGDLAAQAVDVKGVKVLAARLDGADGKLLRQTLDQLKDQLGSAAVVLAAAVEDKVSIVAGVTKDSTDKVKAGDLVKMVAQKVGGKGGGRADMAQGGGKDPAALDSALADVVNWVEDNIRV